MRESGSAHAVGFEKVTATFAQGTGCSFSAGATACNFADEFESTTTYDVASTVPGITVKHPLRGAIRMVNSIALPARTSEQKSVMNYEVSALGSAARIRDGLSYTGVRDGNLWLYTATKPSDFDSYGFARKIVAGPSDANGALTERNAQTTVTTLAYENNAAAWRLGREKSTTLQGDVVNAVSGTRSRGTLSQQTTTYNSQGRVDTVSVLLDSGSADCTANRAQWSITKFPAAEYNALGLPEQIIENGTTIDLAYDALGINIESRSTTVPRSTSSNGTVLEEHYAYDPRHGAITWTENANERQSSATYDAYGRLLTQRGPDQSLLSSTVYDDALQGPWTSTTQTYTSATSSFTAWSAVDGYGRTLVANKQTAANQFTRVARNRYDGFGRLVESFQPGWVATLKNVALPAGTLSTKTTYDGFDRVTRVTLPDGRFTQSAYQNTTPTGSTVVRAQVTTTNPLKRPSVKWFDAVGSLAVLERKNEAGTVLSTFTYDYDGARRIAAVTDSLGVRRVDYDQGGRVRHSTLARKASATPATYSYCYDARSQVASATSPGGREMVVTRDTLGRTARIDIDFIRKVNNQDVATTTSASFYYDCSAAEGSIGRLCDRSDDALSTHIAYDLYGRPYRREYQLSDAVSQTLPASISNSYASQDNYGIAGQLLSRSIEGLGGLPTQTLTFAQDLPARTTGITATDGGRARALVTAASYDPFERLVSTTLGNGVVTGWTFDGPSEHLTSHSMKQGSNVFAELRYPLDSYDANGNIKLEQRYRLSQLVSTKTHTYDALDQLDTSRVVMNGTERSKEDLTITQGNIASVVSGGRTLTYSYGKPENVQAVTSITAPAASTTPALNRTLTYDADGWISRDVETRGTGTSATVTERNLTFDGAGCMREAVVRAGPQSGTQQTTTTRNLCGFGGSRVYRETTRPNGSVERVYYLPGGAELRPEQNLLVMQLPVATSTEVTLAWSLSGGTFVASESGYIHTDVRGSVVARTPIDASDVKVPDREAEYDAWGATLAYNNVATPRYQFTNIEPDPGTGYYYFGGRPYDPTLRRWLAPDALALGAPGNVGVGDLNLYAYAHNNPVRITDKTGTVGNDLPSEQVALDNLAKVGLEHPRETALVGVAAAAGGAAVLLAPETSTMVTLALASETLVDLVNLAVATVDAYSERTVQAFAGVGIAALDLVSGVNPAGDANTGRVLNESRGGGGGPTTLRPGPHAAESIPARSPARDFTEGEKAAINKIGQTSGCHTCGAKEPGTKSGNHIPDHQPPSALLKPGESQQLYPHCIDCSRRQGGEVNAAKTRAAPPEWLFDLSSTDQSKKDDS